jgi:hypothetical protein
MYASQALLKMVPVTRALRHTAIVLPGTHGEKGMEDLTHMRELLDVIAPRVEILKVLARYNHENIAYQAFCSIIAPPKGQGSSLFHFLQVNLGIGRKALERGRRRLKPWFDSWGSEGCLFEIRGDFDSQKVVKFPKLAREIQGRWLCRPISQASPNMGAVKRVHLRGDGTHTFQTDEKGKRKKVCLKGQVVIDAGLEGGALVDKVKDIGDSSCIVVPVRHQMMSDLKACKSIMRAVLEGLTGEEREVAQKVVTESWCRALKPVEHLKRPSQTTALCQTHHVAKHAGEDAVKGLEYTVYNWEGHERVVTLHAKCRTPEGCTCDVCKDGSCKTGVHPFHRADGETGEVDGLQLMKKMLATVSCEPVDGEHRRFECHNGKCKECGIATLWMLKCSLEKSDVLTTT